ncbi:MAG: class A beta-lactamase [Bacteroidota bacterium]
MKKLLLMLLVITAISCQNKTKETSNLEKEDLNIHNELKAEFQQIADSLNGKLGVSVLHIETGESISYNGDQQFPMQSVYKFPIAMVMLHQIDTGRFSLGDTIKIDSSEYIPQAGHSPIRNTYPTGANLTIEDILEYNVAQSDGTACDVLLRLLGGTAQVQQKLHKLGVNDIAIATTEMVQVANDTIQYQNWSTPEAMNELLKIFQEGTYLSEKSEKLLLEYMLVSNKWFDKRIKRLLPQGTVVAHKTGSARTYDGLTRATNDAGIITLPDGTHLAVTVYISDSYDDQTKREMTIAKAARAAYNHWVKD